MANEKNKWIDQMENIMKGFQEQVSLAKGQVIVVGCSTSEVAGGKIGTAGTMDAATIIFKELQTYAEAKGIHLTFQCCEHLNRALVTEKQTAIEEGLGRSNRHSCERSRRGDGNVCISAFQ